MPEKTKNIGGIWEKVSKKGAKFLSGSIEIAGVKHRFTAFRNQYRKPDNNQPEYNIFPAMEFKDGSKENTSSRQQENDINGEGIEIPF